LLINIGNLHDSVPIPFYPQMLRSLLMYLAICSSHSALTTAGHHMGI